MVPNYKRESLKPSPPLHPSPTVKRRRLVPAKHHKSVKGWMRWVWFLQPWAPPVLVASWLKSHFKRGGGLTFVWDGLSIYTRHKLYLRSVDPGHTWPFFLSLHPPPHPQTHTHNGWFRGGGVSMCTHTRPNALYICVLHTRTCFQKHKLATIGIFFVPCLWWTSSPTHDLFDRLISPKWRDETVPFAFFPLGGVQTSWM